jgi:hypothetical protein
MLVSLIALLVAVSARAQAPAAEIDDNDVQPAERPIESAALPAQPACLPTVCALPAPDLAAIAGSALRMPSTTREEMDANPAHFSARAPHLPRSTSWVTYR